MEQLTNYDIYKSFKNGYLMMFSFVLWIGRNGETINLCSYAKCLQMDCVCKSSSKDVDRDVYSNKHPRLTLKLWRGFYHDCYKDITKVSFILRLPPYRKQTFIVSIISFTLIFPLTWSFGCFSLLVLSGQDNYPHLIIAPNAGIAAYSSWLPTIVCQILLANDLMIMHAVILQFKAY